MNKHRLGNWIFVAALCLACGGCVKAKVLNFARYNKAADSFSLVQVYANIATKDERELKHLAMLWRHKDNLILNPISARLQFYTPTIFERLGKHSYKRLALGAAVERDQKGPETLTTSADLDSIEVTPGEFFLNESKNLCYYQQAVIPGKTVDAVMQDFVPVVADQLFQFAEREIKASATFGSKQLSWNDLRELIADSLAEKETKPIGELVRGPFEIESLRRLSKAGADKTVQFTRKANAFTLVLPLSPRDTDEAIATMNLAKKIVAERLKAGKSVDKHVVRLLEATELHHGEKSGLGVTIHVERLMRIVNAEPTMARYFYDSVWSHIRGAVYIQRLMELLTADEVAMPPPENALKPTYATTIESLKASGIEANPTDEFPGILKRFLGSQGAP